jgi:tetratricopeptide (TPR) repeat protein
MRLRRYDEAAPELERSLALRQERYGADHPLVAKSLNQLGNLALYRHHYDVALGHYQRALAIRQAVAAGEDNAEIALAVGNVAVAQEKLEDYAAAVVTYERALALKRRFFGATHREVAKTLNNLANALLYLGRFDEAIAAKRESLAMTLLTRKPDDPVLIENYGDLGETLVVQGEAATDPAAARVPCSTALPEVDKALAMARPRGGAPPHRFFQPLLLVRARVYACLGRRAEAVADAQQALDLAGASTPVDRDAVFEASVILAEVLVELGRAAPALALLEPFAEESERGTGLLRAQAQFARARAMAATGRREEAFALAQRSLASFEAVKDARGAMRARTVRAWLARGGR